MCQPVGKIRLESCVECSLLRLHRGAAMSSKGIDRWRNCVMFQIMNHHDNLERVRLLGELQRAEKRAEDANALGVIAVLVVIFLLIF